MAMDSPTVTPITLPGIGVDMAIPTDMDTVTTDIIIPTGTMTIMVTIPDITMAIITNLYITDHAAQLQTTEAPHQMHLTEEERLVHVLQLTQQLQAL